MNNTNPSPGALPNRVLAADPSTSQEPNKQLVRSRKREVRELREVITSAKPGAPAQHAPGQVAAF